MPARPDKPRARRLVLLAHGYRRVPVGDALDPDLAGYDWELGRGFGLAFYRKGAEYSVRAYGGPEPVIGTDAPPRQVGEWRLAGVYEGSPLFGRSWRRRVYLMPNNALFLLRARTSEGAAEYTLFVQNKQRVMLQTVQNDGSPLIEEVGEFKDKPLSLSKVLDHCPWLLEIPTEFKVEIECDEPETVVDRIRLLGDPSKAVLDLRVNEGRHIAAELHGEWIALPSDDGLSPKAARTLARSFHSDGRGSEERKEIALIRPGVTASWTRGADGELREVKLSSDDPLRFSVEEILSWRLLPLIIADPVHDCPSSQGAGFREHEKAYAHWLGTEKPFLELLRNRLPEDSPFLGPIDDRIAVSGLDTLLDIRIGSLDPDGEEASHRTVYRNPDGGVIVRQPGKRLEFLPGANLDAVLTAHPGILTVPAGESISITADAPDLVADRLTLTGDFLGSLAEGLDDEEFEYFEDYEPLDRALSIYPMLRPLRLTINGTPHLAAPLADTWTVVPIDTSHRGGRPLMSRELAAADYSFDAGSPGGNGSGGEWVGFLRPGLAVSCDYYDEMDGCRFTLSTGDPLEFTAREIRAWPLFPAILDPLLGTCTTKDSGDQSLRLYDGSWWLDLTDEETPRFLTALAAALNASSELRAAIEARLSTW